MKISRYQQRRKWRGIFAATLCIVQASILFGALLLSVLNSISPLNF